MQIRRHRFILWSVSISMSLVCLYTRTRKVVKVKVTLVKALRLCTGGTAHRGRRGIALLFHDHSTRRGWGVSVTPWPNFTPGKDPVPTVQETLCHVQHITGVYLWGSMHLSIPLSVCCLPACLSVCMSVCLSTDQSIDLSTHLLTYLLLNLSVCHDFIFIISLHLDTLAVHICWRLQILLTFVALFLSQLLPVYGICQKLNNWNLL